MIQYSFHYGPFYFHIHAENDKEAVAKAQQALYESSEGVLSTVKLKVELTAGAFEGYVRFDPDSITEGNIIKKDIVEELEPSLPF